MSSPASPVRLGVIGADSSHLPEFARRINALADQGATRCRVTAFWTDGQHRMPAAEVDEWIARTRALGVAPVASMEDLLTSVDGVLVLAVDGRRHLELAAPALRRGLPVYIDKPLACDLASAQEIQRLVRRHDVRCYSASSLRFAAEPLSLPRDRLGPLVAIDAYGPGELHEANPGVFHYGVHLVEMVDAIWGPGVKRVSAVASHDRDLLDLDYRDGRYARLRLERAAAYTFGATVCGKSGVVSFTVNFAEVYNRLVEGMTRFFEGSAAPARLDDIIENIAVMEAATRSIERQGDWVDIPAPA